MKCKNCGTEMDFVHRNDTCSSYAPDGNSYCHNLYDCSRCLTLARDSVWDYPGVTWIYPDGRIEVPIPKEREREKQS